MNDFSFAEYLWLDGAEPTPQIRSKARSLCLPEKPKAKDFPEWRFDGSYTGQSYGDDSGCILRPARVYLDPFRGQGHYIVFCEVHDSGGNTHQSNQRGLLRAAINAAGDDLIPWLGYEQTYILQDNAHPLTFAAKPMLQSASYCGVGYDNVFGRDVAEAHAKACIGAGILLNGISAGAIPGQWIFQVGYHGVESDACEAITAADNVWVARYLLNRVGEQFNLNVLFDDSSLTENHHYTGMPTNFSTAFTRDPRCGLSAMKAIVKSLESYCNDHLLPLGDCLSNQCREKNSVSRDRIIHIPWHVAQKGYGYIEDRRPLADADPYRIGICLMNSVTDGT